MEIIKIISSDAKTSTALELCKRCAGKGTLCSIHDFYGDDPCTCDICKGTGRTTTIKMTVICRVPCNFEEANKGGA
jgi:hypothetical protein